MYLILYISIFRQKSNIEFLLDSLETSKKKINNYYHKIFKINVYKINFELSKYENLNYLFNNYKILLKIKAKNINGDYLIKYKVECNNDNKNLIRNIIEFINFHNNYELQPNNLKISI